MDFIQALDIANAVFDQYKVHHLKWWKRIDGTPILNDVSVRMATAFRDATTPPSADSVTLLPRFTGRIESPLHNPYVEMQPDGCGDFVRYEDVAALFATERAAIQPPSADSVNWNHVIDQVADSLEEHENLSLISQFTALCEEFDKRGAAATSVTSAPSDSTLKAAAAFCRMHGGTKLADALLAAAPATGSIGDDKEFWGHLDGYACAQYGSLRASQLGEVLVAHIDARTAPVPAPEHKDLCQSCGKIHASIDCAPEDRAAVREAVSGEFPPLPEATARLYEQNGYRRASVLPGPGAPLFAADQLHAYVLADRASRGKASDAEDAARYNWLVEKFGQTALPCFLEQRLERGYVADGKASIDATIDAARAQQQGADHG